MARSFSLHIRVMATFIFFLMLLCQSNSMTSEIELKDVGNPNYNKATCPDSAIIEPCTCFDLYEEMNMYCSDVKSDEELRQIFSQPFPYNDFTKFSMEKNSNIRVLSEGIFSDKSFRMIEISESSLETVEAKALIGSAKRLEEITIENGNLTSFPFEELPQYEALWKLFLGNNSFSSFPHLKSSTVEEIDFSHNQIGEITEESIKEVTELTHFYCVRCGITQLYPGTFTSFYNLQHLLFTLNNLTDIPEGVAELHGFITSFHVSYNQITNVAVGAFKGVNYDMSIEYNQLTELPEKVWRPMFEETTGDVFRFDINDNPLVCGCDIAWLVTNSKFMSKIHVNPRCADGTLLTDLDPYYYLEMCSNYTSTLAPLSVLH